MLKVAVVVTARASWARIESVVAALDAHPDVDMRLILAGAALVERYGIPHTGAAERIECLVAGGTPATMAKTTALLTAELASTFQRLAPDLVVTVADRHETLATAIAASYQSIPLLHIQGGEVSGNIDDRVRNAVTCLADIHCVATKQAADVVRRLGAQDVHVTGCPSIDLAAQTHGERLNPATFYAKYKGVGEALPLDKPRLVVLYHPETERWDEAGDLAREVFKAAWQANVYTFWFWPNPDAGTEQIAHSLRVEREMGDCERFHWFKHIEPRDFYRLIQGAVLVGNSSVGIREAGYLGVPVVNVGDRQRGRERGANVRDVPHDWRQILAAIGDQLRVRRYAQDLRYGDGQAASRVVDVVLRDHLTSRSRIVTAYA